MALSIRLILFFCVLLLSSCINKEVMVPAYVHLSPAQLLTKTDDSQGYPSAKVEDYYLFSGGETRGMMAAGSTVPLQNVGKTTLKIGAGIKYNGMAEQRAIYPMFTYYSKEYNLTADKVDSVKPFFSYVENTVFPLIEDFDDNGFELEYNPQYKQVGDTLLKDNGTGTWMAGKYSGKVLLKSGVPNSFLELYSKVYNSWPRFTPFFLELDYKGNIPIYVGMYATTNGETKQYPIFVLNPKTDWNKLYLNLEPEINSKEANTQYRIYFRFFASDASQPEAWIDNLKIVYLD